jgi:hypothetical protein
MIVLPVSRKGALRHSLEMEARSRGHSMNAELLGNLWVYIGRQQMGGMGVAKVMELPRTE